MSSRATNYLLVGALQPVKRNERLRIPESISTVTGRRSKELIAGNQSWVTNFTYLYIGYVNLTEDLRLKSIGIGGKPHGSSPPTPPYMRVRIRRFRDLSR